MKNILVTGGSDGLGKTIAKELSRDNNVFIVSSNKNKLKETSNEIGCKYFACDVTDSNRVQEVVNAIGKVDVLVNCAGLWIQDELDNNDYDRIRKVIEVNLLGVINCSKACIPFMKSNKSGLIININSQAGINHKAERAVYNASKWGVTGFSKSLEDEVKKYGIKVTDIMPGKMKTEMFKKMNIEKSMDDGLDPKEVATLIRFIISLPDNVNITEVGIKNIMN
jgi:3-oxoacyl-[acyl-carrier protein] reductase